jgi:hypothetical protein
MGTKPGRLRSFPHVAPVLGYDEGAKGETWWRSLAEGTPMGLMPTTAAAVPMQRREACIEGVWVRIEGGILMGFVKEVLVLLAFQPMVVMAAVMAVVVVMVGVLAI